VICLSFDTDRMDELRMSAFLDEVPIPGRATFFCTQRYDSLETTDHELAPHTYLGVDVNWGEQLAQQRLEFPRAVGWRSHSCVFSHILAEQLARTGFTYVSIHDELGATDLHPVRHAWGLWHLPIYYMDNLDFSARRFWGDEADEPFRRQVIDAAVMGEALFVFDFHPIHLALNSPNAEEYFARRDRFEAGAPLEEVRYAGFGALSFYRSLVDAMRAAGLESSSLKDALSAYVAKEHVASGSR
jgi:Polysaccharide deacetylase